MRQHAAGVRRLALAGGCPNATMRAALYNESRALRLANQADSRRSAACLPRGCDFGTEDRATESGALPRRAGRPRPAGRSIDADDGVPAAYLRPAGRRAPVVDDARDDDIVIIVRGGRRRSEAAEQRVVYVDQSPRGTTRVRDEDSSRRARPAASGTCRAAACAAGVLPGTDPRPQGCRVGKPTSTEQRARTAGAGRRRAARGRPARSRCLRRHQRHCHRRPDGTDAAGFVQQRRARLERCDVFERRRARSAKLLTCAPRPSTGR